MHSASNSGLSANTTIHLVRGWSLSGNARMCSYRTYGLKIQGQFDNLKAAKGQSLMRINIINTYTLKNSEICIPAAISWELSSCWAGYTLKDLQVALKNTCHGEAKWLKLTSLQAFVEPRSWKRGYDSVHGIALMWSLLLWMIKGHLQIPFQRPLNIFF